MRFLISTVLLSFLVLSFAEKDYKEDLSTKLGEKWFKAAAAAKKAEQGDSVQTTGYTLFLPTDKAFKKLAKILKLDSVEGLVNGDEVVKNASMKVLGYHVVPGNLIYANDTSAIPAGGVNVTTSIGEVINITSRDGKVLLKGGGEKSYAKVLKADIAWEGNVVHIISSVLLPNGFDAYGAYYESLKTTKFAEQFWMAANASENVTGATVFTPIDKAFTRLAKKLDLESEKDLLADEKLFKIGKKVFKYLVIPDSKIYSSDIPEGETNLTTAANETLVVVKKGEKVYITGDGGKSKAYVMKTDIDFNGNVVHLVSDFVVPSNWKEKWAKKKQAKKGKKEDDEEEDEGDD